MILANIIEIWDSILYCLYNIVAYFKYFTHYFSIKKIISKNEKLKKLRTNDTCYIVLNGPSVMEHSLEFLKDEVVFCANYMYKTELAKIICPNYYCLLDSGLYDDEEKARKMIDDIVSVNPNMNLLLNIKGYPIIGERENVYYSYNKYLPNRFRLTGNLNGMFPGFQNVSLYMITSAIYMGYKKIYIYGLDYEPSGFKHFSNNCGPIEDRNQYNKKEDVCGTFFQYLKSQYETYYVSKYAKKNGVEILNKNSRSYVRAFDFEK